MKEILAQLSAYNVWANQRMVDKVLTLPELVTVKEVTSSFNSINLTMKHMKDVDFIWWQRMKLVEAVLPLPPSSQKTSEICRELMQYSIQWKEWVDKSTTAAFEHEFFYRNSKKEQFKQPVYQMLLHHFNHQTYHRGQLTTMLKQLGVTDIPATDFIVWSRTKKA